MCLYFSLSKKVYLKLQWFESERVTITDLYDFSYFRSKFILSWSLSWDVVQVEHLFICSSGRLYRPTNTTGSQKRTQRPLKSSHENFISISYFILRVRTQIRLLRLESATIYMKTNTNYPLELHLVFPIIFNVWKKFSRRKY